MYKICNYFEKGQVIACYYCPQKIARKGPDVISARNTVPWFFKET